METGFGIEYNPERFEAVSSAYVMSSLDAVKQEITRLEGKEPLVITTSARQVEHPGMINYDEQHKVWSSDRPVLILLGTGRGLTNSLIQASDFILGPIEGMTDFNHLSVSKTIRTETRNRT